MPHVTVEYSANISVHFDSGRVLKDLVRALSETKQFNLEDIKARSCCSHEYFIGHGSPEHAFVHIRLAILSGRDAATKERLSGVLAKCATQLFSGLPISQRTQVSVDVIDMDKAVYRKSVVGG